MPRNQKWTVVTGGAGFIGSHLAEYLALQGRRLRLVDDLSTGCRGNIEHLMGPDCELHPLRIGDALAAEPGLFDDVDEVYHLAATVGVQCVVQDPVTAIGNNVGQTDAVLAAAARSGVRVLLTSSSEVYGRAAAKPLGEDDELHYGPTTSPRWSYALGKAINEHQALAWRARCGLEVVIVRLFNTIGPRQSGRYGMVVPRFVQWALRGEPLVVHGDGRQRRAFCDVRDVVRACVALMAEPACHGRVFNVGSDRSVSIAELARLVIDLSGSQSPIELLPHERAYGPGFEDPRDRVPDLGRIREAIGFAPAWHLEKTLSQLIEQEAVVG